MHRRFYLALRRLASEPPFRLLTRFLLKQLPLSPWTRAVWDISPRPAYLFGLVMAAEQARSERLDAISALEFGVAGGTGLVALQEEAEAVAKVSGIEIKVFGFDMGSDGLPNFVGDYRDHPEKWKPGDYPMNEVELRARLAHRTTLILGNVRETINVFATEHRPPTIGFASFDLDLYSSTRDALKVFAHPEIRVLLHLPLYFDDMGSFTFHRHAGELLAIQEFNDESERIKIEPWAGARDGRPFPEQSYLGHMFVAHDLAEASRATLSRPIETLPLAY